MRRGAADPNGSDAARQVPAGEFCLGRYLAFAPGFLACWLLATTLAQSLIFAAAITRFAAGSDMPTARLATVLLADPANPGRMQAIELRHLEAFRQQHPLASLAPPVMGEGMVHSGRLQVSYAVHPRAAPGEFVVMTRAGMPAIDSPGAFGYVQLRYRVREGRLEPLVMVADDPFQRWLLPGFMLFFALLAAMMLATHRTERPLRLGQLLFLPPLNRDWLVTSGLPLRFEPAPGTLQPLAQELVARGAKVRHNEDKGRVWARLGWRATLDLRRAPDADALEARVEGGLMQQMGSLLLVLVAPVAGFAAVIWLLMALVDPFARLLAVLGEIAAMAVTSGVAAWLGQRLIALPTATATADRLVAATTAALAGLGSLPVPPLGWPGDSPVEPLPRWRLWLKRLLIVILLLPLWGWLLILLLIWIRPLFE